MHSHTRSLYIIVFNEEQRRHLTKRHSYSLMGMPHATHTFFLTEFSRVRRFSVKQHHNSSYQPPVVPILSPSLDMSFNLIRNSWSFCRTQHARELGSLHYLVHTIVSYLRANPRPLYFLTLLINELAAVQTWLHTAPEPGLYCTGETHKRWLLQSRVKLMRGKALHLITYTHLRCSHSINCYHCAAFWIER